MRTAVKSTNKAFRTLLLKKRDEILAATRREPEALSANVQSPDAVSLPCGQSSRMSQWSRQTAQREC